MGAINFSLDNKLIEAIQKKLQPSIFFETGTYKGDTVFQQLNNFGKIISVELGEELWKEAASRFKGHQHVAIIHGNSWQVLAEMQEALSQESVIYWLDAHWCVASDVAGEKSQCPLLKELSSIRSLNKESIIIIDDARLFLAPPLPPHEISEWPCLSQVIRSFFELSNRHELMVVNDMIVYYPLSIKNEIVSYAQRYGVDWLKIGHHAEEIINLKKVCEERLEVIERLHKECGKLSKALNS